MTSNSVGLGRPSAVRGLRSIALLVPMLALFMPLQAEADADVVPRVQTLNVDRVNSFQATWSAGSETFQLNQGQRPQFCLRYGGPSVGCVGGTILGPLPANQDTAPDGLMTSFSETVRIPEQVIRRALEQNRQGSLAALYYVRQMQPLAVVDIGQGPGRPAFPAVRLNLGGALASQTLIFETVEIYGQEADRDRLRRVIVDEANRGDGEVRVEIDYRGSGKLSGWWMLWTPSDPPLRELDRFTAASISAAERRQQRSFRKLQRIQEILGPSGKTILTLDYSELPKIEGVAILFPYFDLTSDRSIRADGVTADFPMPVLSLRFEPQG